MQSVLQLALAEAAIALSVFSLITYLWLGLMVLLLGDRRNLVTWVGGVGLLLGALFFLSHGALVGAGVPGGPSPSDLWWRLSWIPAFGAPLCWAATGLHYAGLAGVWKRLRLPALASVAALGGITALLAVVAWPGLEHYGDFIRLLDTAFGLRDSPPAATAFSPMLPAIGVAFVIYVAACASLPWASLVARRLLPKSLADEQAERSDAVLLWDAKDAWSRARPALLVASVCMLAAGAVVAGIGILVLLAEHRDALEAVGGQLRITVPSPQPGHVSVVLVTADLVVQSVLAVLGLTLGRAVVRQGIFVERRLPQRGYLSHWRGMALVAAIFSAVVAWMSVFQPEALPDLLLLVALISAAFAVVVWQSYAAHDRLLAQLRPFVASLSVGHSGWLATDPEAVENNVEALFTSLCRDVLGAARGRLTLTAGRLHRTFRYTSPESLGQSGTDRQEWSLPVRDERGVVALLAFGPRLDGAGYTSADLEVARACGQRILDAVGEFAAAQAIAGLARHRGLETELSAALPRRVLHDEVLPRLHLAMLRLEALRARVKAPSPVVSGALAASFEDGVDGSGRGDGEPDAVSRELGDVVRELGQAHRDLAMLMRAAPMANARRLEHGVVRALRAALDGEFRGTFDTLEFEAPRAAQQAADDLPPITADLFLGAALEAVRNAGRHARGGDMHRELGLRIVLAADGEAVSIAVTDDGVGLLSERTSGEPDDQLPAAMPAAEPVPDGGTRSGLLTHAALVALVGGALTVHSVPGSGTTVVIRVPRSRPAA